MRKNMILGITGGIAAVKALELLKLLKDKDINTEVILSEAASQIIDKATIEKYINKKVYTSLFSEIVDTEEILKKRKVEHIQLADSASVIVVVPATANVIAKLATGIADDYLTTVILASQCQIIICPSMNVHMWNHPATQKNIQTLRLMGYIIIDPDSGLLACGYEGRGRLAAIDTIIEEVTNQLKKSEALKGKRVIVTSGGTKEPIDDVRFITNRSSGKMGAAIADSLFLRGADVWYVSSRTAIRPRYHVKTIEFETAEDLEKILEKEVTKTDYIFHAAAVSDFSIKKQTGKISSNLEKTITLIPREKIVKKIKKWNPNIKLIAFKAEAVSSENNLISKCKEKLQEVNADFIIANDISKKDKGFEVDTNEAYVVSKESVEKIPLASKSEVAEKIVDLTTK